MAHTISYIHPDTDEEYTVTFTVQFAVKCPTEAFSRFQEPEDDDEITIDSIKDVDGNEVSESDFEKHILQSMYDECYMDACEL